MRFTNTKKAVAVVWTLALLGVAVDAVQDAEREADMRTLLVPIELTDAQYQALARRAEKDAQDEAALVASAAVTTAADRELRKIADQNMPRQGGFVGKETGDAEYIALLREAEEQTQKSQKVMQEAEAAVIEMTATVPGAHLTASGGVFYGPSGKEKWYNLPMDGVVANMRKMGMSDDMYPVWVREDGVKMFGAYVMVAADTAVRPKGTTLITSLGVGMVVDHCVAAESEINLVDIAVTW